MKSKPNTAKRIDKIEKVVMTKPEPDHDFRMVILGNYNTQFFVDDKEVTQAVFFSYPHDFSDGFDVKMFGDIDGSCNHEGGE